ncbi:MAG TPA: hypothetical protein VIZ28_05650 [Chitinophagaceae bacterium]
MKYFVSAIVLLFGSIVVHSQAAYPDPEFSNEVYLYRKDSADKLLRLEKGSSKMENKTKMGGFGGSESAYIMDGGKSSVRLVSSKDLSFIFFNGSSARSSSPQYDSMMRANGADPAMMQNMEAMMDPSNTIGLYQAVCDKEQRKILIQKTPGAMPFGSKKTKSSDKFTFSVKKIRAGYWQLVVDKTLPKGEYIFSVVNMGMGNMDGSNLLFAFAID